MKFAQHLQTHLTPEWRKQYIQYEFLKEILYDVVQEAPSINPAADPLLSNQQYFSAKDQAFFERCAEELKKFDLFFHQKLAEAKNRFLDLKKELDEALKLPGSEKFSKQQKHSKIPLVSNSAAAALLRRSNTMVEYQKTAKSLQALKTAFTEFYLSLILLQNYQELNFTGFRKILKKHDKLWHTSSGMAWRARHILPKPFATNKEVDELILATEDVFIKYLEGGNRSKAMNRLRVPPLSEKQSPWTTFRLGLFLGVFLVLMIVLIFAISFKPMPVEPKWLGVRLFRGFLIILVNFFLVGLNVYGWQSAGVNHVLIFEIDPRHHLTYQTLMELTTMFLCIWATCALCYVFHDMLHAPALAFPLVFLFISSAWLLNPFDIAYRSARHWFLREVFYCFTPIARVVKFADFWLADQMNSLVTFFLDMEYIVCFYATEVSWSDGLLAKAFQNLNSTDPGTMSEDAINLQSGHDQCNTNVYGIRPLIAIIPAAIRFLQCLRRYRDSGHRHPHLTNAGKYSTTFFVVSFKVLNTWYRQRSSARGVTSEEILVHVFLACWILAYVVSTCYTYVWDVKMDWGLLEKNCSNKWLREELVYTKKWYYYFAIVADLILRLAWTLNVSSLDSDWHNLDMDLLLCITGSLECFRRFLWNYFRLENEHLNNVGEFRATRDISLRPIRRQESHMDSLLEAGKLFGHHHIHFGTGHNVHHTITSLFSTRNVGAPHHRIPLKDVFKRRRGSVPSNLNAEGTEIESTKQQQNHHPHTSPELILNSSENHLKIGAIKRGHNKKQTSLDYALLPTKESSNAATGGKLPQVTFVVAGEDSASAVTKLNDETEFLMDDDDLKDL